MQTVLEAVRKFVSSEHLRNVLAGDWTPLHGEDGRELPGIRGRSGAVAITAEGREIGADLVEMQPGSAFALHIHPGDHVLFLLPESAAGLVHIDGADRHVQAGDTVFIAAEHAHGVKTYADATRPLLFLAFGHPHKHVAAPDRMRLVDPLTANPSGPHPH